MKPESALPDGLLPVNTAPETEATLNSNMSENIPLILSMPLLAESHEQDQSVHKAPLLIQPPEHSEVVTVPPEPPQTDQVQAAGFFEAEANNEDL